MKNSEIDEMVMRWQGMAFALGIAHGGIMAILSSPKECWEEQLKNLNTKTGEMINKLCYEDHMPDVRKKVEENEVV